MEIPTWKKYIIQRKHQFVEKHKRKFTSKYTLPLLLNQGDGTKFTTVKTIFKRWDIVLKLNAPKKDMLLEQECKLCKQNIRNPTKKNQAQP
jgi:hypothetical protein